MPFDRPQAAPAAAVAAQVELAVQNNVLATVPQPLIAVHGEPTCKAAQVPLVQLFDAHSALTAHEAPAFLYLIAHLLLLQNWL
jgi:hypothetical protein